MTGGWILRRCGRELRRRPRLLGALVAATTVAAIAAGAGVLAGRAAAVLAARVERDVHVIAYLADELAGPQQAALVAALRRIPGVQGARLVQAEEALEHLLRAGTAGAAAAAGLEAGFLPPSVEVAIAPGPDLDRRVGALAERLRGLPGVVEVDTMTEGMRRLQGWLGLGRQVGLGLLGLAAAASLGLLLLAAAAGRAGRREEVQILWLLGEHPARIGWPHGIAGAAAAAVGAALGLAALALVVPAAWQGLLAALDLGPALTPSLRVAEAATVLGVAASLGGLLGWAGSLHGDAALARDPR